MAAAEQHGATFELTEVRAASFVTFTLSLE